MLPLADVVGITLCLNTDQVDDLESTVTVERYRLSDTAVVIERGVRPGDIVDATFAVRTGTGYAFIVDVVAGPDLCQAVRIRVAPEKSRIGPNSPRDLAQAIVAAVTRPFLAWGITTRQKA